MNQMTIIQAYIYRFVVWKTPGVITSAPCNWDLTKRAEEQH